MKKLFSVICCIIILFSFSSCGKPSSFSLDDSGSQLLLPGAQIPAAGAQIAFICTPEQQAGSLGQTIINTLSRFSGEEGITTASYLTDSAEVPAVLSTLELAIKGGAELAFFIEDDMIEALETAQVKYPHLRFIILGNTKAVNLSHNSVSLEFSIEQAGWLAGFTSVLNGIRHATMLQFPSENAQRFGTGFLLGYNAAAEKLNLPFGEATLYNVPFIENETLTDFRKRLLHIAKENNIDFIFSNDNTLDNASAWVASQNQIPYINIGDANTPNKLLFASMQRNIKTVLYQLLLNWKGGALTYGNALLSGIANDGVVLVAGGEKFSAQEEKSIITAVNHFKTSNIEEDFASQFLYEDGSLRAASDIIPGNILMLPQKVITSSASNSAANSSENTANEIVDENTSNEIVDETPSSIPESTVGNTYSDVSVNSSSIPSA